MRQGSNGRRPRGRPQRKQHGGTPRHGNFDSSGPEGRIRGNAHQVYEKYIGLARDALAQGDRIVAETYFQYAEHYYRIVNVRPEPKPNGEGQSGGQSERRSGNGHAEGAVEAEPAPAPAPRVVDEQPDPAPLNDEQPPEAPQTPKASQAAQVQETADRPPPQRRRRPRQSKAAEPQPDSRSDSKPDAKPEAPPSPDVTAGENGDAAKS
jgi:hypothetical protein